MSWTKEDGKVLTRTTSGGEKGEQLIIKRVEPGDEGGSLVTSVVGCLLIR